MKFPCTIHLHGVSFYPRASTLKPGDRILVTHTPCNEFDPNAVAAFFKGHLVGFLPAPVAARAVADHGPRVSLLGVVTATGSSFPSVRLSLTPLPPQDNVDAALEQFAYTRADLAEFLNISHTQVDELCDRGPISAAFALRLVEFVGGSFSSWVTNTPTANPTCQ